MKKISTLSTIIFSLLPAMVFADIPVCDSSGCHGGGTAPDVPDYISAMTKLGLGVLVVIIVALLILFLIKRRRNA
jgi:hypothetical protein